MLALLAVVALQTTPPPPPPPAPTHHVVLHVGGHVTMHIRDPHVRSWSIAPSGVVSLSDIHTVKQTTSIRLTATRAGSTSILFGCDAGRREVWLVDVM